MVSDDFDQIISFCSLQEDFSALEVIILNVTSDQTRYLAGISLLCEGDHRAIMRVMILVPLHTLMLIGMPADLLHTSMEQALSILL